MMRPRSGYTLIEMIISMVLVSALMSSVWGIMSLYNSLLTAGRDRTTQQQLVRSVLQIIEEDLTGVSLRPSDTAVVTPDSSTTEQFPDPVTEFPFQTDVKATSFEADPSATSPGQLSLIGNATALRLNIRQFVSPVATQPSAIDVLNELGGGSAAQSATLPEGMAADVPEFQTVIYQFESAASSSADSALPGGLYRVQADSVQLQALLAEQSTAERMMASDSVSLSRPTMEALLFPPVDPRDDQLSESGADVPEATCDLIPEVVKCQLEYFDGQSWSSTWDSDQVMGLPVAIRISIDVVSTVDAGQLAEASGSAGQPDPLQQELSSPAVGDARGTEFDTAPAARIPATRFSRLILLDTTRSPAPDASRLEFSASGGL
ncbi:MAG: prepilin-type N-terminal cleavage/methylation domain-containing protein [Fuerstiella sp.]